MSPIACPTYKITSATAAVHVATAAVWTYFLYLLKELDLLQQPAVNMLQHLRPTHNEITIHHIISYHITSHHITSYHIINHETSSKRTIEIDCIYNSHIIAQTTLCAYKLTANRSSGDNWLRMIRSERSSLRRVSLSDMKLKNFRISSLRSLGILHTDKHST
jgi:hypothetical protein